MVTEGKMVTNLKVETIEIKGTNYFNLVRYSDEANCIVKRKGCYHKLKMMIHDILSI